MPGPGTGDPESTRYGLTASEPTEGLVMLILGFGPVANERPGPPRTAAMFEEAIPYINPELDSEIKKYTPPGRLEVIGYSENDENVARYVAGLQRYLEHSHPEFNRIEGVFRQVKY